jgi:hypothetical protein
MALVNQVTKKVKMSLTSVVKYQILTYCYLNDINVTNSDLDCLTLLALEGETELTEFCNLGYDNDVFKSPQSVRNAITKAEKKGLVVKHGDGRKVIEINPEMSIQTTPPILLDFKFAAIESKEK